MKPKIETEPARISTDLNISEAPIPTSDVVNDSILVEENQVQNKVDEISILPELMELLQRLGRKLKLVNLFCGGGGVSAAAHETGVIDEVLAIDNWSVAEDVFCHNFPTVDFWNTDISNLGDNDILRRALLQKGDLDILISTAPCPAFSPAKGYIDPLDPSAWLFIDGLSQFLNCMPKCGFIENVPGMDDPRAIPIFNEIKRQIEERLGPHYHIRCFELDASYYLVPQTRKRLIFLLYRRDFNVIPTAPIPNYAARASLTIGNIAPDILSLRVGQSKKRWKGKKAILNTICASEGGMEVLRTGGSKTKISVDELLDFATFPDWYKMPDNISYANAHAIIGNCVPGKFAQAILEHMILEIGPKL